ncbi:hypothetical protein DLI08_24685 [Vibrio parahaemolyticus]|nr:hypothetical protein [Vibrio parahaemolyticus]EGX6076734.1 hypothetical protein [Vibrio parahaemolyticus]EKG9565935.1 hypothetical protein [Vibrio parahaemolyticus]EKG9665940.1 hypothetical protein [Vibrio parahaemolyticus]EKG9671086.1 hypothetical protein [Vibrio parahaemolyticus]
MGNPKTKSNPVTDSALEAAKNNIDGFEAGTDSFNDIGAQQFREGDNRVINQIRENRENIEKARKEFGLD